MLRIYEGMIGDGRLRYFDRGILGDTFMKLTIDWHVNNEKKGIS